MQVATAVEIARNRVLLDVQDEKPTRHVQLYKEHGDITFCVENVLFKLFSSTLADTSIVFEQLFQVPQGDLPKGEACEGKSDAKPIYLPGITANEFENFIKSTVAFQWEGQPKSPQQFLDTLKLAHMYQCQAHVTGYAVDMLIAFDFNEFRAADRIWCARKFNIERFLGPAFAKLCKRHLLLNLMSTEDKKKVGLTAYSLIAQVKEEIELDRIRLAYFPPTFVRNCLLISHDDTCKSHRRCNAAWKGFWREKVSPNVLSPDRLLEWSLTQEFIYQFKMLEAPKKMNEKCFKIISAFVVSGKGLLFEERHIEEGIKILTEAHRMGSMFWD